MQVLNTKSTSGTAHVGRRYMNKHYDTINDTYVRMITHCQLLIFDRLERTGLRNMWKSVGLLNYM